MSQCATVVAGGETTSVGEAGGDLSIRGSTQATHQPRAERAQRGRAPRAPRTRSSRRDDARAAAAVPSGAAVLPTASGPHGRVPRQAWGLRERARSLAALASRKRGRLSLCACAACPGSFAAHRSLPSRWRQASKRPAFKDAASFLLPLPQQGPCWSRPGGGRRDRERASSALPREQRLAAHTHCPPSVPRPLALALKPRGAPGAPQ